MTEDRGSNDAEEQFVISDGDLKEFKAAYSLSRGGRYNLDVQVPYLIKLADGYFSRYLISKNMFDALKAHALYNSIGYRCEQNPKWSAKSFEVQQAYWNGEANQSYEACLEMSELLSKELQYIRNNVLMSLQCPRSGKAKFLAKVKDSKDDVKDTERFCQEMAEVSLNCTDQMVKFCELVIEHSLHSLNLEPPCAFNVIALGSIAKGEATPYSDFEFLFLIEEKGEEVVKYFECLAMTCYFLIGNLRETPLETMDIAELKGWFVDKQMCGFHIDGLKERAGNIPTSNKLESLNSNIVTPNELLTRYKAVLDNPDFERDKKADLTAMLQYTTSVFAHGNLEWSLLDEFLQQKRNIPIKECRQKKNQEMFQADVKQYNFRPDMGLIERGHIVNAKRELYRYPSILLYDISILANCHEDNSWVTLAHLKEKGVISESIHRSIFFLLACACYFRLSAYLFHGSCDDRISVLPTEALSKVDIVQLHTPLKKIVRRWYLPQALFVRHCQHSVPLKNHIEKWGIFETMHLLQMEIQSPNWIVKFQTLHCCHELRRAWDVLKEQISQQDLQENPMAMIASFESSASDDFSQLWSCIKSVGNVFFHYRKNKEGYECLKAFQKYLTDFEESIDSKQQKQLIMADVLEELGSFSIRRNRYCDAELEYKQSLDIRLQYLAKSDEPVARSNFYIGKCFKTMQRFDEAGKHLLEAARIYHSLASSPTMYDYYGAPIHQQLMQHQLETTVSPDELLSYMNNSSVMLGHVLCNLGDLYFVLKYYNRAFNYFSTAQRMFQEAYGDKACHKDISGSLLALAYSSDMLDRYDDADRHFRNAIAFEIQLFESKLLPALGVVEWVFSRVSSTLYYWLVVFVFRWILFKGEDVETAGIGRVFAFHLIHIGHYRLAKELFQFLIPMYKSAIESDENDEEIAIAISFQALNYWKWGKNELAKEHFTKALKILDSKEGQYPKLLAAETRQNMGLMYVQLKDYSQARDCLTQAKEQFLSCCHESDHPKVQEIKRQLHSLPTPSSTSIL